MKKENGEYKTPKELLKDAKFITGLGATDSEQGFAYEFAEEVIRLSTREKALVVALEGLLLSESWSVESSQGEGRVDVLEKVKQVLSQHKEKVYEQ